MWKMLDDLSENDPDGYSKFIKGNLEQGREQIKKERDLKVQKYTFPVESGPVISLTFPVTLTSKPPVDQNSSTKDASSKISSMLAPELHEALPKQAILFFNIFSHSKLSQVDLPSLGKFAYRLSGDGLNLSMSVDIYYGIDKANTLKMMGTDWKNLLGLALNRVQNEVNS